MPAPSPRRSAKERFSIYLIWLPLVLAVVATVGLFVRMQVYAEDGRERMQTHEGDKTQHLSHEVLQREFVPRQELDHRLDSQDKTLDRIEKNVEEIRKYLLEQR